MINDFLHSLAVSTDATSELLAIFLVCHYLITSNYFLMYCLPLSVFHRYLIAYIDFHV